MGIANAGFAALNLMARDGLLTNVKSVFEIGAQELTAPGGEGVISDLFVSMGKIPPDASTLSSLTKGAARHLFDKLGIDYQCSDTSAEHGSISYDLNFDSVAPEHREKYDFVTNWGTTEHAFNQANCFKTIHDLTKKGGLILHHVPLRAVYDACFYNYHPEIFICLARSNAYEILGMWIDVDYHLPYLIPYTTNYFDFFELAPRSNTHIFVVMRKLQDAEFNVPYQRAYENLRSDESAIKYRYTLPNAQIVNGDFVKKVAVLGPMADIDRVQYSKLARAFLDQTKKRLKRRLRL